MRFVVGITLSRIRICILGILHSLVVSCKEKISEKLEMGR